MRSSPRGRGGSRRSRSSARCRTCSSSGAAPRRRGFPSDAAFALPGMIVLVTGAGGFVGPHLVRALRARGHAAWGSGLEEEAPPLLRGDAAVTRWTRWDVAAPDAAATGTALLAGEGEGG